MGNVLTKGWQTNKAAEISPKYEKQREKKDERYLQKPESPIPSQK